jgi:hypothetical protein
MKFKELVKTWSWQILAITFALLFLGKGCTSKKVNKVNSNIVEYNKKLVKTVDSLSVEILNLKNSSATKKEVEDIMEKVMLEYLIYEDDLDRGKTSLF